MTVATVVAVALAHTCFAAESRARKRSSEPLPSYAGKATIIDGDGIEIAGTKIRLFGVDAPEIDQYCRRPDGTRWRCGQYATVALDRLAGGKEVSCAARAKDRYGRPVAVCTLEGRDLAGELAREGWALAYRQFSSDYVDEEEQAKVSRAGVWNGELEAPWAWRAQRNGQGARR